MLTENIKKVEDNENQKEEIGDAKQDIFLPAVGGIFFIRNSAFKVLNALSRKRFVIKFVGVMSPKTKTKRLQLKISEAEEEKKG